MLQSRIAKKSLNSKSYVSANKVTYLSEFNASIYGPLHEQHWTKEEAIKFHKKMSKLKQFFCKNCNELWPSTVDFCGLCKANNLLYSKENDMVDILSC